MDILGFGITVPIFYIIGLVVFVKWLVRGGGSVEQHVRRKVAADLRLRASSSHGASKESLLDAAHEVEAGFEKHGHAAESTAVQRLSHEEGGAEHVAGTPASIHASAAHTEVGHHDWTSLDVTNALHSLDNINLLLYLGAFLVVVSAGIFVGYNFSTLSGGFKTTFLALFAAIFYGTGLTLFLKAPKLRPAGTTFTGIGLVLVPLVGLAAYNFTPAHDYGSALWFLTSLITLALYVFTLATTRQTYIAYLMAFTTLSLFESGVSLVKLPLYWFGWGMGTVAIILAVLARWRGWWDEAADSLTISANLFVPASLVLSLVVLPDHGLAQMGITFGIAALFYALMARRFKEHKYGVAYWLAALVCIPAAAGFAFWDKLGQGAVAGIFAALACVYLLVYLLIGKGLQKTWQELLGLVAALLPALSAIISHDEPRQVLAYLLVTVAVAAVFAVILHEATLALIASLAALFVPYILLHDVWQPSLGAAWIAVGYLALSLPLVWWRFRMDGWDESAHLVGAAGYLLAYTTAMIAAVVSGHLAIMLVGIAVAASLYWLSFREKSYAFIYLASAMKYLAAAQIVPLTDWPHEAYAMVIIVVGSASYALGYYMDDQPRGQALRYSAIMATLLGSVFGISGDELAPIASMALGGGLLWTEARRQAKPQIQEVAVGVLILSLNWVLAHYDVTNIQIHALPWAAYLAWLGYRRRHLGHETYDIFAALSLAVLTFPIAGQALGENGQLYGLELIFLALGLVLVGSSIRYRLVQWWGAGTLVLEVLYQIRDFLYALPKYVISAALGLALLATAIVLLQRRRQ